MSGCNDLITNREIERITKEIDELKAITNDNVKRIYELERELDLQEMAHQSNVELVTANRKDIEEIKDKPNKREGQIISVVISVLITAIVTYILSQLK